MTEMLLSAGASVEAGVSRAYEMIEKILERFNNENRYELREYTKVRARTSKTTFCPAEIRGDDDKD